MSTTSKRFEDRYRRVRARRMAGGKLSRREWHAIDDARRSAPDALTVAICSAALRGDVVAIRWAVTP